MRVSGPIAVAILVAAMVCASLAWIAISEQSITLGGKTGTSHAEGLHAVIHGFVFLGAALWLLGMFASASRWRNLIWMGMALAWAGGTAIYFLFFYA